MGGKNEMPYSWVSIFNLLKRSIKMSQFERYFSIAPGVDALASMLENVHRGITSTNYPPFDLVKMSDSSYRFDIALAGFTAEDVNITIEENKLSITGSKPSLDKEQNCGVYLHRGISQRQFVRTFMLLDHTVVDRAVFENGILSIYLHIEIPEEKKKRTIPISLLTPQLTAENRRS